MTALEGKAAIVTGGGQGIGLGIARALTEAGARAMLSGRTEATLASAAKQLPGSAWHIADGRDPKALQALVASAVARFGGVDILVNNAQQVPLGRLADVDDDAFVAGFESGPLAAFRLMKLVAPVMKARGGGTIFNLVSSAAVRWDMAGFGAYGAVKQAMRVLTRAAASEWGADRIRVLSIAPHALTPAMNRWMTANPDEARDFLRSIPLGRPGDAYADIGRAVAMLAGDSAGYLTGATITLDGGQANFDCVGELRRPTTHPHAAHRRSENISVGHIDGGGRIEWQIPSRDCTVAGIAVRDESLSFTVS